MNFFIFNPQIFISSNFFYFVKQGLCFNVKDFNAVYKDFPLFYGKSYFHSMIKLGDRLRNHLNSKIVLKIDSLYFSSTISYNNFRRSILFDAVLGEFCVIFEMNKEFLFNLRWFNNFWFDQIFDERCLSVKEWLINFFAFYLISGTFPWTRRWSIIIRFYPVDSNNDHHFI